jgi:hypothetical protein
VTNGLAGASPGVFDAGAFILVASVGVVGASVDAYRILYQDADGLSGEVRSDGENGEIVAPPQWKGVWPIDMGRSPRGRGGNSNPLDPYKCLSSA